MMRILYLIAGLIYDISPVDLMPDIAPPITYADDAVVTILMLYLAFRRTGRK